MVTIAEPKTQTKRSTHTRINDRKRTTTRQWDSDPIPPDSTDSTGDPLEWFIDDDEISREDDDPFHILLLNQTFVKNPRMTIQYAASSLQYVLSMPFSDAEELAEGAKSNGFSCLGTWTHKECLTLGVQLQQRDLVVRIVPFVNGGGTFWQARDASSSDGAQTGDRTYIYEAGGFD